MRLNGEFTVAIDHPASSTLSRATRTGYVEQESDGADRMVYPQAFGAGTRVEYRNTSNGVKEEIILERNVGRNTFDFRFRSDRYDLALSEDGTAIYVVDKTFEGDRSDPANAAYIVNPLYVYDSYREALKAGEEVSADNNARHFSEDGHYVLTPQEDGSIVITAVVSEEFLNNPSTVYPVVVDPSFSNNTSAGFIDDTYISQSAPSSNYSTADYMRFGNYNGGKCYGMVKFPNMMSLPPNAEILNAQLKLTFRSGQTSGAIGEVYRISTPWNSSSTTWANSPSWVGGYNITSWHNGFSYYEFQVGPIVRGWYDGSYSNNGFLFKYKDETINDYNSVCSFECGEPARMPKLTIEYRIASAPVYGPTDGIEDHNVYFIRSAYSNRYLDTHATNTTNVVQYGFMGDNTQRWRISYQGDGYYSFAPMDRPNYRLSVQNGTDANSANVNISQYSSGESTQLFRIISNGNGTYRIQPKISSTRVLDVTGPSLADNANIQLWTYSGVPQQQWWLETEKQLPTPLIGQGQSNLCWAASALMLAKTDVSSSTKTLRDVVTYVKGSYKDEGGSTEEAVKAANYAANGSVKYAEGAIPSEITLLQMLHQGKAVYVSRGATINGEYSGHATVIYGYRFNGALLTFLYRDPASSDGNGRSDAMMYEAFLDGPGHGYDNYTWRAAIYKTQ